MNFIEIVNLRENNIQHLDAPFPGPGYQRQGIAKDGPQNLTLASTVIIG